MTAKKEMLVAEVFADGKQPEAVVRTIPSHHKTAWEEIRAVVEGYVEEVHTKCGTIYVNEDAAYQDLPVNSAASKVLDWLFPEAETVVLRGNVVFDLTDPKMAKLVDAALLLRSLATSQ